MAWKSVLCVVVLAEIHYCQSTSHEHAAAVSLNPIHHNYFLDPDFPVSPLVQPNVYITTRRKRSPKREVGCPHEEGIHEFEPARRESNPMKGWLHQDGNSYSKHIRHQINNAHSRGRRSTSQQQSNNNFDHNDYPDFFSLLKKKMEEQSSRRGETRENERNRQRHRTDHDTHRDRSRTHSNPSENRGHEHDRQRHRTDHNTHRDKPRIRLNSRV